MSIDENEPEKEQVEGENIMASEQNISNIYAIKTTASQEQAVSDMIAIKEHPAIHAILSPDSLTSYVMVEADEPDAIGLIIEEIPHARTIIPGESSVEEIGHFLTPN